MNELTRLTDFRDMQSVKDFEARPENHALYLIAASDLILARSSPNIVDGSPYTDKLLRIRASHVNLCSEQHDPF